MTYILLIEPDSMLAKSYSAALAHAGYEVAVAHSAQAAILSADAQLPDCVVLELQLSNHSGIEFLYEFRSYSEWQRLPVIVHSFIPEQEFASSKQLLHDELGVTTYLYKPKTSLHALVQAVDSYNPAHV